MWRAYIESYVRRGNDPYIGRKLSALLVAAGAAPVRCASIWFGTSAGEPTFAAWVANFLAVMNGARDQILSIGSIDAAAFDMALAALREWGTRSDSAVWFFLAYAEGMKRA
jgi:hypothetical protein